MSKLFIIENNVCKPQEEVLLITPFKEIWESDETTHKEDAIKKFTFMEFYASKSNSNPYAEYDSQKRLEELSKNYLDRQYFRYNELPEELIHGIHSIEIFQREGSASMRLYEGLLASVDKLIDFLNDIDPSATTMTGTLIMKPVDILNSVAKAKDAVVSLDGLRKQIEQEQLETSRTKGNKVIGHYERT
jgi:hypothetical protein